MSVTPKNLLAMRDDFEAIRALALTGMLISHWYPPLLPGGYVLMDVFL